ncbi:MAG: YIP1 family protein [Litoreibacter sp.]
MQAEVVAAFSETVRTPQQGLARVIGWNFPHSIIWMAAFLVVVISAILNTVLTLLIPDILSGPQMIPSSPFLQAIVYFFALVLSVLGTHYIGRLFGGTGDLAKSLTGVVWLQGVLLVFQVGQIVLLVAASGLGALYSIVLFVFTIWLYLNFVAAIHGFKSLALVFMGFIASSIGVGIGLALIISTFAILIGLETPNV